MTRYAILGLVALAVPTWTHAGDKPAAPLTRAELDERIHKELRNIINRGATIHNNGDVAGCYRIYQGALLAYAPLLDHRAVLHAKVLKGLSDADQMPDPESKAFALRAVIDAVRDELKPAQKPMPPAKEPTKDPPKEPGKDK